MIDLADLVRTYNKIYQEKYHDISAQALAKAYRAYWGEYFALSADSPLRLNIDLFENKILPFLESRDFGIIDISKLSGKLTQEVLLSRLTSGVKRAKGGVTEDRFGPYQVIKKLGSGAYGIVYLGKKGTKKYAIKEISISLKDIHTLNTEIELLRKVSAIKPQVTPKFIEAFTDDAVTKLYIVIEYMNCGTLEEWSRTHELTKENVADIKRLIVNLHRHHVYHRDLHDGNILVNCQGKSGKPKFYLADFGLSHTVGDLEQKNYEFIDALRDEEHTEARIKTIPPTDMIKDLIIYEIVRDRRVRSLSRSGEAE